MTSQGRVPLRLGLLLLTHNVAADAKWERYAERSRFRTLTHGPFVRPKLTRSLFAISFSDSTSTSSAATASKNCTRPSDAKKASTLGSLLLPLNPAPKWDLEISIYVYFAAAYKDALPRCPLWPRSTPPFSATPEKRQQCHGRSCQYR